MSCENPQRVFIPFTLAGNQLLLFSQVLVCIKNVAGKAAYSCLTGKAIALPFLSTLPTPTHLRNPAILSAQGSPMTAHTDPSQDPTFFYSYSPSSWVAGSTGLWAASLCTWGSNTVFKPMDIQPRHRQLTRFPRSVRLSQSLVSVSLSTAYFWWMGVGVLKLEQFIQIRISKAIHPGSVPE